MKILAINLPNLDLSYFTKRGLNFEVKHINLDIDVPLKFLYNFNGQDFYSPDLHNTLNIKFHKFEQSFILYGYTSNDPKNTTGGYAYFDKLNSGSRWASVRIDGNENKYAVHELHHLICGVINIDFKDITPKDFMDRTPVGNPPIWINYYLNHDPENPESNHGRTWANIIPFLPKLKAIQYQTGYKYFSKAEVEKWKLKPELWTLLDKMREECGFAFNINSGLRTKAENDKLKDSASDSAHLSGLAVDISIKDSLKRSKIVQVAFNNGINRIGIADTFVHIDVDKSKVQNVIWLYN